MANQSTPLEGELTLLRSENLGRGLRRSRRYRCALAMLGKITFPDLTEANMAAAERAGCDRSLSAGAFVLNLSKTGIGLSMAAPLAVGKEINLRLNVPGDKEPRTLSAHVIHVTQELDKTWRVGCEFASPLTAELLELLLQ